MRNRFRQYFLIAGVCLLICLSGVVCAADGAASGNTITASVAADHDAYAPYQAIIDKLNEEYGFSMSIAYEEIEKGRCRSPLTIGLDEYERSLRQSIEECIRFNEETTKILAQLGDLRWEKGELTECPIMLLPSGSCFDSVLDPSVASTMLQKVRSQEAGERD